MAHYVRLIEPDRSETAHALLHGNAHALDFPRGSKHFRRGHEFAASENDIVVITFFERRYFSKVEIIPRKMPDKIFGCENIEFFEVFNAFVAYSSYIR